MDISVTRSTLEGIHIDIEYTNRILHLAKASCTIGTNVTGS